MESIGLGHVAQSRTACLIPPYAGDADVTLEVVLLALTVQRYY